MGTNVSIPTQQPTAQVRPSLVEQGTAKPFTLDQELKEFASWVDEPLWVPPKDASKEMAETMLRHSVLWKSWEKRWDHVVKEHRDSFTQVRQIELVKASIRLPKGKLYVSVTDKKNFDTIEDDVPDCVQTRLEEFLAGPGRANRVKVSYLKPLCIEVEDELHFTSRSDIDAAIEQIQKEVYSLYRRMFVPYRTKQAARGVSRAALAVPRTITDLAMARKRRALDAYHAKLEFQRRKTALRAARNHQKWRTDGCTFDEMLALTNPLEREDVIGQYGEENELSKAKQQQLIRMVAGHLPWFTALSMGLAYISTITITAAPPVALCDPVFVAEFPNAPGVLMNIGHFDEVGGVKHVEF